MGGCIKINRPCYARLGNYDSLKKKKDLCKEERKREKKEIIKRKLKEEKEYR